MTDRRNLSDRRFPRLWLLALTLGCVAACGEGGLPAPVESSVHELQSASGDYYILSRLDDRLCPAPACGGYFVKMVNQTTTRCADNSQSADCHAHRLDFTPSALAAAESTRFEQDSFASGFGVVKAVLARKSVAGNPAILEDVLTVSEAWQGQAHTVPKGSFSLVTPTGRLCGSGLCDAYDGFRLGTSAVDHIYNVVNLSASGATGDTLARGQEALSGTGIIVAGSDALVWDPISLATAKDLLASEFYRRASPCTASNAQGTGACGRVLGYKWDGLSCVAISGCICTGTDCGVVEPTMAACQNTHDLCISRGCGPGRPSCLPSQYCDFPDTGTCGTTGQAGLCRSRPTVCAAVSKPVCACSGRSYDNACAANADGVDVAYDGACR